MTNGADDLWPKDIGSIETETPASVIRKQAGLLGNKTSNLVEGLVSTKVDDDGDNNIMFHLYAPALGDYHYKLFTVYHKLEEMYPVYTHYTDDQHRPNKIKNVEELKDYLKSKFNSEKTLGIIRSLMAQSQSQ